MICRAKNFAARGWGIATGVPDRGGQGGKSHAGGQKSAAPRPCCVTCWKGSVFGNDAIAAWFRRCAAGVNSSGNLHSGNFRRVRAFAAGPGEIHRSGKFGGHCAVRVDFMAACWRRRRAARAAVPSIGEMAAIVAVLRLKNGRLHRPAGAGDALQGSPDRRPVRPRRRVRPSGRRRRGSSCS